MFTAGPRRLEVTLPKLVSAAAASDYDTIVVLDDSIEQDGELNVEAIVASCSSRGIHLDYHGPRDQQMQFGSAELLQSVHPWLSSLRSSRWTLGHNRNYAILLALLRNWKSVLFVDDDIHVSTPSTLRRALQAVKYNNIVSANIVGRTDHSIVGYIFEEEAETLKPVFTSGSFMAINLDQYVGSHQTPFMNVYNEDWIWIMLQNFGDRAHVPSEDSKPLEVTQLEHFESEQEPPSRTDGWDSIVRWQDILGEVREEERYKFQERGEILMEGIYKLLRDERTSYATHFSWQSTIEGRRKKIQRILSFQKCRPKHKEIAERILQFHSIELIHEAMIFEAYNAEFRKWLWSWRELILDVRLTTSTAI